MYINNREPSRSYNGYSSEAEYENRTGVVWAIVGSTLAGILGFIIIIVIIICIIKACKNPGSRGRVVRVQPVADAAMFTMTTTAHAQAGYPSQPYPLPTGGVAQPPYIQQPMTYEVHPHPEPLPGNSTGPPNGPANYFRATKQ